MQNSSKNRLIIVLIILTVIILISASGVIYTLILLQRAKIEAEQILNRISAVEEFNLEVKKLRFEILKLSEEKAAREIIEFNKVIETYKTEYEKRISKVQVGANRGVEFINIAQIKNNTTEALNAAIDFKDKLDDMDFIPKPMQNYYDYLLVFLDNVIAKNKLILSYYDSKNYSNYDDSQIKALDEENSIILQKIKLERAKIYKEYGIEYLLNE